jgi:hypothetical protein
MTVGNRLALPFLIVFAVLYFFATQWFNLKSYLAFSCKNN